MEKPNILVVDEALSLAHLRAASLNIHLASTAEVDLPQIPGDREALLIALTNFL